MTTPHIPHPGGGRDRDLPTGPPYAAPGLAVDANVRTSRSAGKIVAAVVAGLFALCCAGGVIAAVASGGDQDNRTATTQDDTNRQAAAAPSTSATGPASAATSSPAATKAAPPAKPTKTTPPPVILSEGIYVVGEDIPPGRYKVVERAGSGCYWSRKDADDTTNIIDNSIGGGFPQFTAKRGEQVEVAGCPDFRKIK